MASRKLRIAFIHPDLGIGGAERLVVDAALGLQRLGHNVNIYTSHHDPSHCFEETRDGTLQVHHIRPPFPRALNGKLHILFAHLKQLHLTWHLLRSSATAYDVYFVDQLSTCIPFLRAFAHKRVVFYCHFPDKLLADGEFVADQSGKKITGLLKRIYRYPMDWLEETTTGQADVILANSNFTANVFRSNFSIPITPRVIYPGINVSAYEIPIDIWDDNVTQVTSTRPTLLSLNRFEKKKNAALAVEAFARMREASPDERLSEVTDMRLVLAGGYDPRLQDNIETLNDLIQKANTHALTYYLINASKSTAPTPLPPSFAPSASTADILFLLNFTTPQRSALLNAPSTLCLLYTPANEHFGIGPVEGMVCGLPVLACNSGGPTETVVADAPAERTGWLVSPTPELWAESLKEILRLGEGERAKLNARARERAKQHFGLEAMSASLEEALFNAVDMGPVDDSALASLLLTLGTLVALYIAYLLVYY